MADRQQRMSTQSVSWEVEETDDPISGRITQVDESTIKLPGGQENWVQNCAENCAASHLLLRRALEPLHCLLEAVELGELGAARPGALGGGGGRHETDRLTASY